MKASMLVGSLSYSAKITALYEQLSREDKLQGPSNSISNQQAFLEDYAKRNGFTNVRHYTSFDELTAPMLNVLVEKVVFHGTDKSTRCGRHSVPLKRPKEFRQAAKKTLLPIDFLRCPAYNKSCDAKQAI